MSTIREVLDRKGHNVLTVTGDTSVLDAIRNMSDANIGSIVICDDAEPIGIFTERDYLRKIVLEGRSSDSTPVARKASRIAVARACASAFNSAAPTGADSSRRSRRSAA